VRKQSEAPPILNLGGWRSWRRTRIKVEQEEEEDKDKTQIPCFNTSFHLYALKSYSRLSKMVKGKIRTNNGNKNG
jgi:hypothetical protein